MAKADRLYFENLVAAADCACKCAHFLVECLSNYHPEKLKGMLTTMHEYEHTGDIKKHEMSAALARAFVTPVDREDLALVSQNIDEVTDSIEEVLQLFYMYRITRTLPQAVTFAEKLAESCELMKRMLGEFENFTRPARLHELTIELNHKEEECDVLHLECTTALPDQSSDVLEILSWREIYSRMEACADACEHVGDCVDMVIMKNS